MLPELFKEKMKSLLSEKEYDEFISSFEEDEVRHHALRLNPLKVKEKPDFCKEPVPWEENGFYYDADSAPGKHPYHEAGIYYIQEPSAMSPVHFLDPRPGEKILDLCAAPGGKSPRSGPPPRRPECPSPAAEEAGPPRWTHSPDRCSARK